MSLGECLKVRYHQTSSFVSWDRYFDWYGSLRWASPTNGYREDGTVLKERASICIWVRRLNECLDTSAADGSHVGQCCHFSLVAIELSGLMAVFGDSAILGVAAPAPAVRMNTLQIWTAVEKRIKNFQVMILVIKKERKKKRRKKKHKASSK